MTKLRRDQRRRASTILRKRSLLSEVVTEAPGNVNTIPTVSEMVELDNRVPPGDAMAVTGEGSAGVSSVGPPATGDPARIYADLNLTHLLSRLEEPAILTAALAVMIRQMEGGSRIAFPRMAHVDRLHIAQCGLPTDCVGLQDLLGKVYARRGLSFDPRGAFDDAVRTYGRRTFDYSKPFDGYRLVYS